MHRQTQPRFFARWPLGRANLIGQRGGARDCYASDPDPDPDPDRPHDRTCFRFGTGLRRQWTAAPLRAELEHVAARVLARKLQNATDRRVALSALRRAHARSREDTRRGQSEGPGRRRRVIASSPRQTLTDGSSASPIGIQQRVTGRSLRSKLVRRRVACAASAPAFSSGWTSLHAVESWSAKSRHHGAPVSCATARSSVAFVGLATHARSPGSPLS